MKDEIIKKHSLIKIDELAQKSVKARKQRKFEKKKKREEMNWRSSRETTPFEERNSYIKGTPHFRDIKSPGKTEKSKKIVNLRTIHIFICIYVPMALIILYLNNLNLPSKTTLRKFE